MSTYSLKILTVDHWILTFSSSMLLSQSRQPSLTCEKCVVVIGYSLVLTALFHQLLNLVTKVTSYWGCTVKPPLSPRKWYTLCWSLCKSYYLCWLHFCIDLSCMLCFCPENQCMRIFSDNVYTVFAQYTVILVLSDKAFNFGKKNIYYVTSLESKLNSFHFSFFFSSIRNWCNHMRVIIFALICCCMTF